MQVIANGRNLSKRRQRRILQIQSPLGAIPSGDFAVRSLERARAAHEAMSVVPYPKVAHTRPLRQYRHVQGQLISSGECSFQSAPWPTGIRGIDRTKRAHASNSFYDQRLSSLDHFRRRCMFQSPWSDGKDRCSSLPSSSTPHPRTNAGPGVVARRPFNFIRSTRQHEALPSCLKTHSISRRLTTSVAAAGSGVVTGSLTRDARPATGLRIQLTLPRNKPQ